MSQKAKLISIVAMICLVVGIMLVGIFAAETQQIKLNGQVNFEIADKSLYVKDVRMQENMDTSAIYSLKDSGRFMPGYINTTFIMNLGNLTNTYGSFALYFDIINTVNETSGETFAYTIDDPADIDNATVSAIILDSNGSSIDRIPQGTVKPSEITFSTPISATIKVTVRGTAGVSIDLSQIMITLNQYVPQVYDYFDFEVNDDDTTVTLTSFDEDLADTTDIVIPESVSQNESGQWTDGNTYKVTDILSATSSSNGVFYNSGITSIELPSTLEMIGNYAFYYCSGLTSITLPSSLTSIGEHAFQNCSGIETLEYKGTIDQWLSIDFGAYCMDDDSHTFIVNGEELTNLVVPEGITTIPARAFYGCTGLTNITLPSSLNIIGDYAFSGCTGLTKVDLSNYASLTSIGNYAFEDCRGLTSVDLSQCTNLKEIAYCTFQNCTGLIEVDLSNCISLTTIGLLAFCNCSSLATIDLSDCISLISIEQFAFRYCSTLTNIILTNCVSLENIGVAAFHLCTSLERIDFDTCVNLSVISPGAFEECYSLRSIILPYPYEWYITDDESSIYGDSLDMSDPEQNAEWFTVTYVNYYFKRNI